MSTIEEWLAQNLTANKQRVSHCLNLALPLENPLRMPELLLRIQAAQPKIRRALTELNFVHFARFLPSTDGGTLYVVTEFDGPLEPYVMDFAVAIGEEFSMILSFVRGAAHVLPVKTHPDEFWAFIRQHNRVAIVGVPLPADYDYPLYSAYPERSVLDIVGERTALPPPVADRPSATIADHEVQGNILRGYRPYFARHFVLEVTDWRQARQWFAALAGGPQGDIPAVTSNRPWQAPPVAMLNVGFTHAGLRALRAATRAELDRFPAAFREGPADPARALANGDVDASAPAGWRMGRPGEPAHAMLSLYAFEPHRAEFDRAAAAIAAALPAAGLALLSQHHAQALGNTPATRNSIYFGYRDGLSDPRIAHPCAEPDDMQPASSAGEFLLHPDYEDIFGGPSCGALPQPLVNNGSFCAVRLLEQHVDRFDALLAEGAAQLGVSRELVAAKIVGRWRDGTPLSLFPDDAAKAGATAADAGRNDFDYMPSYEYPNVPRDHDGRRCPVGAHIRRTNPRTSRAAGVRHSRRLLRRGMPYTLHDAGGAVVERGLFGMFFCGSLARQFEFIQQQWVNGDLFTSGIRDTQDPIVGAQTTSGLLNLPGMGAGGSTARLAVPRLATTRGSLYLFMPGLPALKGLANAPLLASTDDDLRVQAERLERRLLELLNEGGIERRIAALFPPRPTALGAVTPGVRGRTGFDPNAFDPADPGFIANPYPAFAEFRRDFPVWWVPRHEAWWAFGHAHVAELYRRTDVFLKLPPGDASPRGLFSVEQRRHDVIRPLFDAAFLAAGAPAAQYTQAACAAALHDVAGECFDFVARYAARVPREVLFKVMGIPDGDAKTVDKLARIVLHHSDRTEDAAQRLAGIEAGVALSSLLAVLLARSLLGPSNLLKSVAGKVLTGEIEPLEAVVSMFQITLAGYLSVEFLLASGVYNLLRDGAAPWQALLARPPAVDPTQDDVLRKALEEMRRFDSPLGLMDRYAGDDGSGAGKPGVTFFGQFIAQGCRVVGMIGSGNRDERVFADAERFDITRTLPPHSQLALGLGARECIGLALQAVIAPIALAALLHARPRLKLLSPGVPPWLPNPYYRSIEHLQVGDA